MKLKEIIQQELSVCYLLFLQISVFSQWLFGFRKFKVLTYWTITVLNTGNDSFISNKPVKNNDFGADSSLKTRASYF